MTDTVDYRPQIKLSQAGASACFLLCNYQGKERQFFYMTGETTLLGHVTECKNVDNETLALKISNFYENWKTYLVPAWLAYHKISPRRLEEYNGGKEVYLNST
jgi:hypothetical protein